MTKRAVKKAEAAPATMNPQEAVDLAFSLAEVLTSDPTLLESASAGELELRLEDVGWLSTSGLEAGELKSVDRAKIIARSRACWLFDPLCRQSVRLWTNYALSSGITFKTEDEKAQAALDAFFFDKRNRPLLGSQGQRQSSNRLLLEGDIFFVLVNDEEAHLLIRRLDPLEVTTLLTDPTDAERVVFFRRNFIDARGNQKTEYYRSWTTEEDDNVVANDDGKKVSVSDCVDDAVLYHVAFEPLGKRGVPLLTSVAPWSSAHRKFMEARVAIVRALAKFAWLMTVQGTPEKLAAVKKKIQSTLSRSTAETNPPAAPGSTGMQNVGVKLEPSSRVTGGSESRDDGDMLKLMVAAGVGWPLHYYGDAANANLATAEAMELPVLKQTEAYRDLWVDTYRDILELVLERAEVESEKAIDVSLPPILMEDAQKVSQLHTAVGQTSPELVAQPEWLSRLLSAMRVDPAAIPEIIDRIKPQAELPLGAEQVAKGLEEAARNMRKLMQEAGR